MLLLQDGSDLLTQDGQPLLLQGEIVNVRTPTERTFRVPADVRIFRVPAEDRVLVVT